MRSYLKLRSILALALGLGIFFCFGANPSYGELVKWPDCEGPGCLRTAQTTAWPPPLQEPAFTIELHRLAIGLPSPPKRVMRQWGGDIILACQDGSWFSFSLETKYTSAEGVEMPARSNLTVADSGQFTFTKTAKDPAPDDPNDLWVWRRAIHFKSQVFGLDNPVYAATKGPLAIYFWEDFQIDKALLAFIFDASDTSNYIRVYAQNVAFEDFKKIIGTVNHK